MNKAIEIQPNYAEAYHIRGSAKGLLGKHEESIKDFTHAIKLDPNDANAYYNRGIAKHRLGFTEEAQKDKKIALELQQGSKEMNSRMRDENYF